MLSVKKVKELLKNKNTPDKEAETIRDGCRNLVEIIFEQWHKEKVQKKKKIHD